MGFVGSSKQSNTPLTYNEAFDSPGCTRAEITTALRWLEGGSGPPGPDPGAAPGPPKSEILITSTRFPARVEHRRVCIWERDELG